MLFPYALILKLVALILSDARIPGVSQGTWGEDWIAAINQWGGGNLLLSTFLIFIQAILVNRLVIKHSLLGEIHLLPGVCYILLASLHPAFLGVSSIMLANTTLLIAAGYLFDALKKEFQEENKFMLGLWIGVTGLLFSPYLLLGLFGLISLSILKTVKLKEAFQYITGFISPFLLSWLFRVVMKGFYVPASDEIVRYLGIPHFMQILQEPDIVVLSIFGLILMFSLLGYTQIVARKNIYAQKKIDTYYIYLLFTVPMGFFLENLSIAYLQVLLVPVSLFLAILLRQMKLPAIAESVHFILVVIAILTQVLFLI